MINARAETLATSRAFGGLVERPSHRCLVLADGFYEWIASKVPKQPRLPLRFSLAGARASASRACGPRGGIGAQLRRGDRPGERAGLAGPRPHAGLAGRARCVGGMARPELDASGVAPLLAPPPADAPEVAPPTRR